MIPMFSPKCRLVVASLTALVAVALVVPIAARGLQKPGERMIYVSVMDNTGTAVPDMKAAEFVVKEDGVEQVTSNR